VRQHEHHWSVLAVDFEDGATTTESHCNLCGDVLYA
jgi:hypothetical protein